MEVDYSIDSQIPVLTGTEATEVDQFTICRQGVESRLLMGWAGYAAFSHLRKRKWYTRTKRIHFLLGKGNNGGDGYVLAWHILNSRKVELCFWMVDEPSSDDAKYYYNLCKHQKTRFIKIANIHDFEKAKKSDLIVDAIFGTGLNKPPSKEFEQLFKRVNKSKARVVSLDIASGVFADGQLFQHHAIKADTCYTFGSYKIGHLLTPGILHSKKVKVLPIGFSLDYPAIPRRRLRRKLPYQELRKQGGHKYKSGELFILGGSEGMQGAAMMAGQAFLKLGGGLARIYTGSGKAIRYITQFPELMIQSESNAKLLQQGLLNDLKIEREQVMVMGVGLKENLSSSFISTLVNLGRLNLIIDGSALKQLYQHREVFKNHKLKTLVLTPHFSEAESLLGRKITNIREAAIELAEGYQALVYFKGPGGIIATPKGREVYINSRHSELATGGTGDVLCGIIASMFYRYKEKTSLRILEMAINTYLHLAEKVAGRTDFLTASEIYRAFK